MPPPHGEKGKRKHVERFEPYSQNRAMQQAGSSSDHRLPAATQQHQQQQQHQRRDQPHSREQPVHVAAHPSLTHSPHSGNYSGHDPSHGMPNHTDADQYPPGWLPMHPARPTAAQNLPAEGLSHHTVSHVMPGPPAGELQPQDWARLADQLGYLEPFSDAELAKASAGRVSPVAPQGQRIPTPPPPRAAQDPVEHGSNFARAEAYLADTHKKYSESYQRQVLAYAAAADHEDDGIVNLFSEHGYAHHHCRIRGCDSGPRSHTKNDNTCTGRLTAQQYEEHFRNKHPDKCIYRCYLPNCERDSGFKTEQSLALHVRTKLGLATRKKVSQPAENLDNHLTSHAWAEAFLGDESPSLKVTPTNKMKTRGYAAAGDHEGVVTFLHRFGHGHHHCRVQGCAAGESSHTASDWSCTGRLDQKQYENHMMTEHGDRFMYRCYHPRCWQRELEGHGFKREKGLTEHIKKLEKNAGSEEGPATSG